jgi:hypothetical protein
MCGLLPTLPRGAARLLLRTFLGGLVQKPGLTAPTVSPVGFFVTRRKMTEQANEHKRNIARPTEGSKQTGAVARTRNLSGEKRGRGRPVGSKTRAKSLVPAELAKEMLLQFKGVIPDEHYEYLRGVVQQGKAVSTERELDILILLLGRNLHPALIGETKGEDEVQFDEETGEVTGTTKKVVFRKDVTERLKVLNSLLSLRHQVEKAKEQKDDGEQPLLKIVATRDLLDGGRLGVLIGGVQETKQIGS